MTKKEKRDNARVKTVKKIIDSILLISGAREVVEGPRGKELFELMERDTYDLLAQYEDKYVLSLTDNE